MKTCGARQASHELGPRDDGTNQTGTRAREEAFVQQDQNAPHCPLMSVHKVDKVKSARLTDTLGEVEGDKLGEVEGDSLGELEGDIEGDLEG